MPQRLGKNSRKKYGLQAAHTPQYHASPTETANIPLWQPDGLKFVTKEDFEWLIKNGHIEMEMPAEVTADPKEVDPQS
ncbi:hypothetical protein IID24_05545 [Patescibacteria group bacterium]|nr:hypothetical protein [Patescibacteria group bacterium]